MVIHNILQVWLRVVVTKKPHLKSSEAAGGMMSLVSDRYNSRSCELGASVPTAPCPQIAHLLPVIPRLCPGDAWLSPSLLLTLTVLLAHISLDECLNWAFRHSSTLKSCVFPLWVTRRVHKNLEFPWFHYSGLLWHQFNTIYYTRGAIPAKGMWEQCKGDPAMVWICFV